MRVGQEGIHSIPAWIEPERMGARFRPHGFQAPHLVGLEDLDQTRLADGDVEMPAFLVEEDHVGNAGQLCLRRHGA